MRLHTRINVWKTTNTFQSFYSILFIYILCSASELISFMCVESAEWKIANKVQMISKAVSYLILAAVWRMLKYIIPSLGFEIVAVVKYQMKSWQIVLCYDTLITPFLFMFIYLNKHMHLNTHPASTADCLTDFECKMVFIFTKWWIHKHILYAPMKQCKNNIGQLVFV